jgi:5-methyltetrahydrofolate--homocysteine methyltransferase
MIHAQRSSFSGENRPPASGAAVLGTRVLEDIPLNDVFPFVNEVALIRGQWQVRKGKLSEEEYRELLQEKVYPVLERLKEQCARERLLQAAVV